MSFNWDEFLVSARELSQRSDEAARRSAINRAYYAAYQTARHHRGCQSARITRGGSHREIWFVLKDSGNPKWRTAGNRGLQILQNRLEADYDDAVTDLTTRMYDTLRMATEILRALQ